MDLHDDSPPQSDDAEQDDASRPDTDVPAADTDPLLVAVRAIEDLPVGERAAAFERLNRSLVGALNQLEQL